MPTEQTTSPRCEPCSLLRLLRKTTRTPRSCRPITLAHCHTPVPAAALVSSSSRDSPPAVSPSTDPVRPHRPAGSTHHDDANATQPTQHRPSLLAAPGRPRRSLPKCWKSTPIIYPTLASETPLPACDRPKLSSRHSSSILLVPTRTISRALSRHQISIEPAAEASLPSATSCIAGLPTPADAGCGCGSPRPASANLYSSGREHAQQCLYKDRIYSITSSARASSDGGISMPSAFAVLRLTTNWNFVGCSMGRSAGFAPFRTLST